MQDPHPCFYIYRQQKHGHVYTGLIGCGSIDDYFSGLIKIHEQTITERFNPRRQLVRSLGHDAAVLKSIIAIREHARSGFVENRCYREVGFGRFDSQPHGLIMQSKQLAKDGARLKSIV